MALVLVWVRVVHTLITRVEPRPPIGQPQAIVWDKRVFTTDRQLKGYLDSKGASYTRWVSKHPGAFAVLRHTLPLSATATAVKTTRAHAAATPKPKPGSAARPQAKPKVAKATPEKQAAPAPGARAESPWTAVLTAILLTIGGLLFVSAAIPARRMPERVWAFYKVPERRIGVLGAAIAIIGGLLISLHLR